MRLARLTFLALASAIAVSACASAPATWTYAPAPSITPAPSADASGGPSAPASGNVYISALNVLFDQTSVDVPADAAFKIDFDNKDAGVPHNVVIHTGEATGPIVFTGETFNGVALKVYDVPALTAGGYTFICSIHPTTMVGVMNAK